MFDDREPRPTEPRRSSLALPVALLFVATAALAYMLGARGDLARMLNRTGPPPPPRSVDARGDLAEDEKATIAIYERCSPSVVFISPLQTVPVREQTTGALSLRDVPEGIGTGFVWDTAGHIVTNYHVVAGSSGVLVDLQDGSSYHSEDIVGYPDKDIAVITVDAPSDDLVPLLVGSSSDLKVGQKIFAIGNPFGYDATLTDGIISALGRKIRGFTSAREIQDVIQTNAAINPGNSGGPLLDSAGRLIGVTTMIYSETGGNIGLAFAIPVDDVRRVVTQLIENGHVVRPGLGVLCLPDQARWRQDLPGPRIREVMAGSAAERAGLQGVGRLPNGRITKGDIILKVNDIPVPDNQTLFSTLEKFQVGDTVQLTIERDEEVTVIPVTLQEVS
jgi:S1-C subfamily serine protease